MCGCWLHSLVSTCVLGVILMSVFLDACLVNNQVCEVVDMKSTSTKSINKRMSCVNIKLDCRLCLRVLTNYRTFSYPMMK